MNDTAILAFQTAAGVTPDEMSLWIRTLLFAMTLLWATWCVVGLTHRLRHHGFDELDIPLFLFRILLCVVITLILVNI